jgi:hypothetical protein
MMPAKPGIPAASEMETVDDMEDPERVPRSEAPGQSRDMQRPLYPVGQRYAVVSSELHNKYCMVQHARSPNKRIKHVGAGHPRRRTVQHGVRRMVTPPADVMSRKIEAEAYAVNCW